jgi:predicted TIM-barrel fold metal-dependent hydrolase
MHTPLEAIAELRRCDSLGIKAVALGSLYPPLDPGRRGARRQPPLRLLARRFRIDSGYDYDPVWRTCQELGYAVTFHSAAENYGLRNSISNFVFNHIGHFGEAGNAVCKALFLGGVMRRFPQMQFAFLEGGVPCGPAASFPN